METRPSSFPPPDPSVIPTGAAAAPPRRMRGWHREERREVSLLIESLRGAKRMQWKPLTMRAVGPLESRLCVLRSQADYAQTVYPRS